MYAYLKDKNKIAFVNQQENIQVKQAKLLSLNTLKFGEHPSDVSVQLLSSFPFVSVAYKGLDISSRLTGKFNFYNIAAAIAVGEFFRVLPSEIREAIEMYDPTK